MTTCDLALFRRPRGQKVRDVVEREAREWAAPEMDRYGGDCGPFVVKPTADEVWVAGHCQSNLLSQQADAWPEEIDDDRLDLGRRKGTKGHTEAKVGTGVE